MEFWQLIIISLFATNLIKNANSVGEGGHESKLYKTFDEIYGKGWDDSKDLNCRHVKEEVQDGQAPNTSDQKNIEAEILKKKFDEIYGENWSEDENNSAPDQDESVDEQQNDSNKCEKIESDQKKREIIGKFREMKEDYREKNKRAHSANEWNQIEIKISKYLGVSRTKVYKWIKELDLNPEKFSELEKRKILKQFDEIKCKCKKAKLKNFSKNELADKIAKKMGVCRATIFKWKRKFGLSISNKSDATKIEILKKYAKIKEKNPKMTNAVIAEMLKISKESLHNWKKQFKEEIKNL